MKASFAVKNNTTLISTVSFQLYPLTFTVEQNAVAHVILAKIKVRANSCDVGIHRSGYDFPVGRHKTIPSIFSLITEA